MFLNAKCSVKHCPRDIAFLVTDKLLDEYLITSLAYLNFNRKPNNKTGKIYR